jgi:peptidoglycan-associated lipoprotein
VPPERLVYRGYGESCRVGSYETSEGRAENRRVEFVITQVTVVPTGSCRAQVAAQEEAAGKCAPAQCKGDDQCPSGGKCERGRCQAPRDTCSSNADCGEGQECKAGKCVTAGPQECNWEPVRFGFNEATLTSEAQSRLSELADCIKATKVSGKITLEGHADERGTEEYNLQLSNRRAASVKKYLSTLGLPARSLETVGYGETRPATQASDEEAWSQNRRVEFRR